MKSRTSIRKGWLAILPILAVGAIAPVQALGASDLSITKTDSADPVTENSELTYTITVSNAGPDAADGVQVLDNLPSQVDPVSSVASQGTCVNKGKKVTCELGMLPSGAAATVTIRVMTKKAGQLSNTATLTTSDADPYTENNSDTETTQVVAGGGGGGGGGGATCAGQVATIVGTGGADTLTGTPKRDVIKARGGNDSIRGLQANDIVCAGAGNDTVKGGSGNDRLKGGPGRDLLKGGGGDDDLFGGPGRDRCRGGSGQDTTHSC